MLGSLIEQCYCCWIHFVLQWTGSIQRKLTLNRWKETIGRLMGAAWLLADVHQTVSLHANVACYNSWTTESFVMGADFEWLPYREEYRWEVSSWFDKAPWCVDNAKEEIYSGGISGWWQSLGWGSLLGVSVGWRVLHFARTWRSDVGCTLLYGVDSQIGF